MTDQMPLPVPTPAAPQSVVINSHCMLRIDGERRLVVVSGLPVLYWLNGDAVAEAYAGVQLVEAGWATQVEVARAFGCTERTVRRNQRRFQEGGMAALAVRSGWKQGRRRLAGRRERQIERMSTSGLSNREIARRMGVTENAIRKQVGPSKRGEQTVLPFPAPPPPSPASAPSSVDTAPGEVALTVEAEAANEPEADPDTEELEPVPMRLDADPLDRTWDRLLACTGCLDDAAPLFADALAVPGAGVLFALPALVASGIFPLTRKVMGEIGPAFYGLRTTLLTLLLMALWRIKRPEALKEHDPRALGRVLGLDRAPEVKTLRRKLTRMASLRQAERLGRDLARLRVNRRGELMGFLYVDGHVRAYHGKRKLPKTHVARLRLSMPATTDYWVNDAAGDPLFVVTAPANAGMTKMLVGILQQARELVGDRRITIVFDRGGLSPKLFKAIIDAEFDILTYRKGKSPRVARRRFELRRATIDGAEVEYLLADQNVRFLGGRLRLRQVTRLTDDGHQTPIITSRKDLSAIEIAWRMFERWRQENFFKYMREEFLLDALSDYQVEPDDPTRTVPNPGRRTWDKKVKEARAEVAEHEQAFGAAVISESEGAQPTFRGFNIASETLGKALRAAKERLADLLARRRAVPIRVEVRDVCEGEVVRLAAERKHLTNIFKMVAYQAESDMLALVCPHYARADQEGRTLLHEVFRAAADIKVSGEQLVVTLHNLSSPHRSLAVQAICDQLNDTATIFPGTALCLRFEVHPQPSPTLAFPGPRDHPPAPSPPAQPDIS